MKNLFLVLSVLFLFGLTSCSDVVDNSLLTNPVIEKDGTAETLPSPVYPYPYLFNFSKVDGVKFLTNEGEEAIEFYMPDATSKFLQIYVVVHFYNDCPTKLYFVDKIEKDFFKVYGLTTKEVRDVYVYGLGLDSSNDIVSPCPNNTSMNEIAVNSWKVNNKNIEVECGGTWPSSLKYVYAEIETKQGTYFVFLQKPWGPKFSIPQYAQLYVTGLKLYGYQSVTEAVAFE